MKDSKDFYNMFFFYEIFLVVNIWHIIFVWVNIKISQNDYIVIIFKSIKLIKSCTNIFQMI